MKCQALLFVLVLITQSCSKYCGKDFGKHSRISGGHTVHPNLYPWMVYFTYLDENSKEFQCGGSLISDIHVLTAKHCIDEAKHYGPILVSVHDIDDPNDYMKVEIDKTFLPEINPKHHDIAILKLKRHLDLKDPTIGTVCLPKSENEVFIGKNVKGMGWGMDHRKNMGNLLKAVDLVVDNITDNNYLYTKVSKREGMWQDTCAGDSGGPLVYNALGHWSVIGVVHGNGYNCHDGTINGDGKWQKVTAQLKWINRIIADIKEKAIHGGWSEWTQCTRTCNGIHTRTCTNPEPEHGGLECGGNYKEDCNMDKNCNVFNWSIYEKNKTDERTGIEIVQSANKQIDHIWTKMFNIYDEDNDETISLIEAKQVQTGFLSNKEQFKKLDRDADDKLTLQEFKNVFRI